MCLVATLSLGQASCGRAVAVRKLSLFCKFTRMPHSRAKTPPRRDPCRLCFSSGQQPGCAETAPCVCSNSPFRAQAPQQPLSGAVQLQVCPNTLSKGPYTKILHFFGVLTPTSSPNLLF